MCNEAFEKKADAMVLEELLAAANRFSDDALASMPVLLQALGKALQQVRSAELHGVKLLVHRMIQAIKVGQVRESRDIENWVEEVEVWAKSYCYML